MSERFLFNVPSWSTEKPRTLIAKQIGRYGAKRIGVIKGLVIMDSDLVGSVSARYKISKTLVVLGSIKSSSFSLFIGNISSCQSHSKRAPRSSPWAQTDPKGWMQGIAERFSASGLFAPLYCGCTGCSRLRRDTACQGNRFA